jgi:chitodextrinase
MLIYGTDPDFASWICSGFAGSTLAFDIAGLATNADYSFNANCNGSFEAPATVVLQGSPFVNFATRDLRPAWDSPIVDAGGSTSQAGGEDIDGGTRIVDGNNDGTDTVDIGALEYQAAPPSGAITAPSTGTVGQALSFSHSMVDPDPTNSIASVLWSFGDGSTSTLNAPAHAYAAAGTYDVTLSATNQAGSIGTATARIVIPVVPATLPGVGPPIAKLIAKPKQSFKIGKGGVSVAKTGAPFFSVTYTDTSKSKFTLQSIGKRKKLKTVKGSQTLTVPAATTPLKLTFGGTWNKKRLAAGSYRLTITPLAADGTAGRPVRVDLKLKK